MTYFPPDQGPELPDPEDYFPEQGPDIDEMGPETDLETDLEEPSPTKPGKPHPTSCVPWGQIITKVKPYWYIVQPSDINEFWRVPTKFGLPAKKGDSWYWHQMRNANTDWLGGMIKNAQGVCVLSGLTPGATLHIPGDWPEAPPNVPTSPKTGVDMRERKPGTTPGTVDRTQYPASKPSHFTTALIIGAIGFATIGGLAWVAHKQRGKR
jgi:hypothetical protein